MMTSKRLSQIIWGIVLTGMLAAGFNVPDRPYEHVCVIENTNFEQTVQSVLKTRAKDSVFCNPVIIQKLKTIDYTEIYE